MFCLVLCSVFIILRAEANVPETENPVIHLSYKDNRNDNYIVWKDKPLKISIENGSTRYVWCFNSYKNNFEIFVPETEFTSGNIHILNITNVTAEMSTRWKCTALEEYHGPAGPYEHKNRNYTATNLHFRLHVKGARAVILNANNQNLTYVTTDLSVNYDGQANYSYEDGENFPMDFSCKKAEDKYTKDTLRLEYYNAEGVLLFQTNPRVTPHTFRFTLKSNNDKYYLDCIRAAGDPEREYRYRTTFFKRDLHPNASQHAVILSVNGQKLSTSLNNDKSYDNYIFRYIDGEVLTVTCQKRDVNIRGHLVFFADRMSLTLMSYNPSEAVISLNTSDIQNKSLICGINNTNAEKPNARLLFLSDVPGKDVRIRGLPRNNILYQYTNNLNQWTIEYLYSANETLDLTCLWNEGFNITPTPLWPHTNPFWWYFVGMPVTLPTISGNLFLRYILILANEGFHDWTISNQWQQSPYAKLFQWKFENKWFDSAATEIPNTQIKISDQPLTRILNATHTDTKIKCTYFPKGNNDSISSKTVEMILRLKPGLVSLDTQDDKSMSMIVPIAVGVGVAIAVITMVCLVSWGKRTKRANLIENAYYNNLSNQTDSPIPPFPSQWEDDYDDPNYAEMVEEVKQENYYYSTDNDKSWRMPDKRQSNTSDNHYTEIDDYPKPKLDGLAANWNTARPSNCNKQTDTPKPTPSHSSNNIFYNNFIDPKQGTYDKLSHNNYNLPLNNSNENYSNVPKPSKSVTFRPISNDLRPGHNYSERNSRQDGRDNETKVKPNNDSYCANTGQDSIYMQAGKPIYRNNFLQNEKTDNPLDTDYAEPYGELGMSCKNDFYG